MVLFDFVRMYVPYRSGFQVVFLLLPLTLGKVRSSGGKTGEGSGGYTTIARNPGEKIVNTSSQSARSVGAT